MNIINKVLLFYFPYEPFSNGEYKKKQPFRRTKRQCICICELQKYIFRYCNERSKSIFIIILFLVFVSAIF